MAILSNASRWPEGSWQVVLAREELHLFVGFTKNGVVPDDEMNLDDFLATVPKSQLRREAHGQLVQLLRGMENKIRNGAALRPLAFPSRNANLFAGAVPRRPA